MIYPVDSVVHLLIKQLAPGEFLNIDGTLRMTVPQLV